MVLHVGTGTAVIDGPHQHSSVYEAKVCQGIIRPLYVPPPPVSYTPPAPAFVPPSRAQLNYVRDLGGDVAHARTLEGGVGKSCSVYISQLVADKRGSRVNDRKEWIPTGILGLIPDGRYAWRPDESVPFVFIRVSRPKTGQYRGTTKVQTKHSDAYSLALVEWKPGEQTKYRPVGYAENVDLIEALKGIWIDKDEARYQYALHYTECGICGKSLTDERSRWYGIGPDCETRNEHVIEYVHNHRGEYVPSR